VADTQQTHNWIYDTHQLQANMANSNRTRTHAHTHTRTHTHTHTCTHTHTHTQTLNSWEVLQLVARLYKYISHVETSVLHCVAGSQQTYIVYVHSGQQFGGSVAKKHDSKHFDCSFVALKNGISGNNSA